MASMSRATESAEHEESVRRSACDRCRGQKLRCERLSVAQHATNLVSLPACRRCQRARAACITSTQRRLMRSPQEAIPDTNDGGDGSQQPFRKRQNTSVTERPLCMPSAHLNTATSSRNVMIDPSASLHSPASALSENQPRQQLDDSVALYGAQLSTDFPKDLFPELGISELQATGHAGYDDAIWQSANSESSSSDLLVEIAADILHGDKTGVLGSIADNAPKDSARSSGNMENGIITANFQAKNRNAANGTRDDSMSEDDEGAHASAERSEFQYQGLESLITTLVRLNSSVAPQAARAERFFCLQGSSAFPENIDSDDRQSFVRDTVADSDKFVNILATLLKHTTCTNEHGESFGVFGTDFMDVSVVIQLVSLYVSSAKLYNTILQCVEDSLLSKTSLNWCRGAYTTQITPISESSGSNNGYLLVRVFTETCVHFMDVMHRRLELLVESGRLDDTASGMLKFALKTYSPRRRGTRSGEACENRHTLEGIHRTIMKLLQESLG